MILEVKEKKPIKCDIERTKDRLINYPSRLEDCYSRYSKVKELAYQNCIETLWSLDELKSLSNVYYGISSHNGFMFTFTGLFERVNKETGEVETWLYYSTKTKDEIYKLIQG